MIIYEKNDKRRITWLIDHYVSGRITAATFCDEFYYSYDLAIDHENLTAPEALLYNELSEIAGRFSEFEEDHKNHPGAYFTEEELRQKVLKTQHKLNQEGTHDNNQQ